MERGGPAGGALRPGAAVRVPAQDHAGAEAAAPARVRGGAAADLRHQARQPEVVPQID